MFYSSVEFVMLCVFRVLSGLKNLGGGGDRGGRAGVIIVKQELCVFNKLTFCKFLGGKQNLLEGEHTLLTPMQMNPWSWDLLRLCNSYIPVVRLVVFS